MSNEEAPPPKGKSAFEERYTLDVSKPLNDFDTPGGRAYLLVDREAPETRPLYGLVHNPIIPLRNNVYLLLKKHPVANMVSPVDRGLVTMTLDGKEVQRLVTAFVRPTGGSLFKRGDKLHERVNAAMLRQHVVLGALKSLAAIHKRGIVHRSISADKMFFVDSGSDEIMLGECVSTPPGYMTPMALEPIDSAFIDDRARGEGTSLADFYQLGAALQSLYFGKKLWMGRDNSSLLISRVNQGSFWTIGGGQDVPGALGNLIKGLMADEAGERWITEDILDWFEGMGKPKRTVLRGFAMNRPTTFKGVAYVDRRLLAFAFARDPRDAASFLRKLDFASWVQISMRDEVLSERIENVINVSPKTTYAPPSALDDYRMVARVCMFLHPCGSIRYKGFVVDLDGIPHLLANAFANDNRDLITAIVEILDSKFLSSLEEICAEHHPAFSNQVERVKPIMEYVGGGKGIGGGMERVLYELNPTLPCMSPRFERVWIVSIKQIMSALDRIAERGGGKNVLSDRHVSAFIAARGGNLDRAFNKLAAVQHDPSRFASLSADFFAGLQRMAKLPSLPNFTSRIVESLGPAVRGLKNKKRREKVSLLLDKVKKGGDISKLTTEINLTKIQVQDQREFSQARTAIMKIERERNRLSKKITPNDPVAQAHGYRGARVLAGLIFGSMLMLSLAG